MESIVPLGGPFIVTLDTWSSLDFTTEAVIMSLGCTNSQPIGGKGWHENCFITHMFATRERMCPCSSS